MSEETKLKDETVLYKNSILIDQISGILEELDAKEVLTVESLHARLDGRVCQITIRTYIESPSVPEDEAPF